MDLSVHINSFYFFFRIQSSGNWDLNVSSFRPCSRFCFCQPEEWDALTSAVSAPSLPGSLLQLDWLLTANGSPQCGRAFLLQDLLGPISSSEGYCKNTRKVHSGDASLQADSVLPTSCNIPRAVTLNSQSSGHSLQPSFFSPAASGSILAAWTGDRQADGLESSGAPWHMWRG